MCDSHNKWQVMKVNLELLLDYFLQVLVLPLVMADNPTCEWSTHLWSGDNASAQSSGYKQHLSTAKVWLVGLFLISSPIYCQMLAPISYPMVELLQSYEPISL